jgi:hypothetical protein
MGHYAGETLEQYTELEKAKKLTVRQALYRDWLKLFRGLTTEMTTSTTE